MFPNKLQLDQGGSLALIFLQNGGTDLISVKSVVGKFFKTKYGDFQLNSHLAYGWGKKRLYFYYQGYANPLDIESVVKIVSYLKSVDDPILRATDLDNQTTRDALGYEVLQFLDAFQFVDQDAIEHALDMPLRNERKLPVSTSLVAIPPTPMPPNVGLYVNKDRRVEMVKLTVKREAEGLIAKSKVGDFNLSDKKTRHTHGKSSLYVLFEGQSEGVYLNVSTFLPDFVPYEPIAIMDVVEDIRYTNKTVQAALKKVEKKPFNMMLIMIAIIGFVVIYQVVINPAIQKQQTDADIDRANKAKIAQQDQIIKEKELDLQRLQLQQQQQNHQADVPVIGEH